MWFTIKTDQGTIRFKLADVALIEEVPSGFIVTLDLPAQSLRSVRPNIGEHQTIELTPEQAEPLISFIDSIAIRPRTP